MSKQSLSVGFQAALIKITADNALEFAGKIVTAYAELESKYNASLDEIDTAAALIEEQAAKIQKAKTENPNYRPVAKIKTNHFRVNHAVRDASGAILSIEEVAANQKLVQQLADSGSTAVTKLTEEEIENL